MTLGNAMKVAVTSQFGSVNTKVINVQAGGVQLGPPGSLVANPLTTKDVDAISKLSSVDFAVGRNLETISIEYNDKLIFSSAISISEGYESEIYELMGDIKPELGRLLEKGDSGRVILGNNFLDEDKNGFEKEIVPGKDILVNNKEFYVQGILEKTGALTTDSVIFMNDNDLNELANYGNDIDIIGVKVKDKDLMDRTKEDIEKLMRQRRDVDIGEEDFSVNTPESSLETVNSILGAIQIFIIIIASISILVGSIGIINTMTTSVLERTKEIGIMKSIGARNSQIFFQFFVESGFLGLIGGIIGAFLGILIGFSGTLAINNWIGSEISFEIDFVLVFFTLIGSFFIGALAGVFPAMKASKQNPVEALRE
ncbi:MAG: ABC transporter permease [Nanoarchaeota archaeon]